LQLSCLFFSFKNYEENNSWKSLVSDAKIAVQVDKYDEWKYATFAPHDEGGRQVSGLNYFRISWALIGMKLIKENPLGYGLIDQSFGSLSKVKWPESTLTQSHSGWMDLTLGIGVPGIACIFLAIFLAIKNLVLGDQGPTYEVENISAIVILFSLSLIWVTSELSQKIYVENIFFWIMFSTGLSIGYPRNDIQKK
jgi:hypothetical protein